MGAEGKPKQAPIFLKVFIMAEVKRVGIYIDGNNLFYGALKHDERRKYRWLNPELLVRDVCDSYFKNNLVKIQFIKFYTARVSNRSGNLDAPRNQQVYFNALRTIKNLEIILGNFQLHEKSLPIYPFEYRKNGKPKFQTVLNTEEKGSDVNLGVHLVYDACSDKIDAAIVITNDTDLAEPIRIVATKLGKPIINLCPHKNVAFSLKKIKNVKHYVIKTTNLAKSQFPDSIEGIIRPYHWSEEQD